MMGIDHLLSLLSFFTLLCLAMPSSFCPIWDYLCSATEDLTDTFLRFFSLFGSYIDLNWNPTDEHVGVHLLPSHSFLLPLWWDWIVSQNSNFTLRWETSPEVGCLAKAFSLLNNPIASAFCLQWVSEP